MTPLDRLRITLTGLSLTAIDARLEALLEAASKKEPSYADFLLEVMSVEADARKQRYMKTRLQLAHLPYIKTFDQFDFGFQPSIDERQIRELRTLRFIHEASNVVLLGPPGVGKTHIPWPWLRPPSSPATALTSSPRMIWSPISVAPIAKDGSIAACASI